jgi:hypothetical protein
VLDADAHAPSYRSMGSGTDPVRCLSEAHVENETRGQKLNVSAARRKWQFAIYSTCGRAPSPISEAA